MEERTGNEINSVEQEKRGGRIEHTIRKTPLVVLSNAAIAVERVRLVAQIRLTHLEKKNGYCPDTRELLRRSQELELWVDKRLAKLTKEHPTAHWFTLVKGTGGELIGKVLGHIENFGKFYPVGSLEIPSFVKRLPVKVVNPKTGKEEEMVWVEGIERLTTPSKLRKYAGLVPRQRKTSGKKLGYNADLKMMLWRLGVSFLKAQGRYSEFYYDYKERLIKRFQLEGIKVLPTPKGKFCPACEKEVRVKTGAFCPDCNGQLSLKTEPEGVRWEGHIHLMAHRRMLQLFLNHLWVVWREALGLPLRDPYPMEYLGHTAVVSPWDMVDK